MSICDKCIHDKVCLLPKSRASCELFDEYRPRGEWERWGSPFSDDTIANSIVCSICKARYVEIEGEVFNFCPNCGADMRKRGKEKR